MKKIISLLSVLTITGTSAPTLIAASPYQKGETINKTNTNYQQTNNLENLTRNKRDFYEKEQIEFFNNDFFYKFNIDYTGERNTNGAFDSSASVYSFDSVTLIKDWTKYASSWEDFYNKFPEIELTNFNSIISGNEITKENLKINNIKNKNSNFWSRNDFNKNIFNNYRSSSDWTKPANQFNDSINELNSYYYNNGFCVQKGKILFRLYVIEKELKAQVFYSLHTSTCTSSYKARLNFKSIRLVGKIDINPLLLLTIGKVKQFDIWASNKEKELKTKREDPNYNKTHLLNEENSFKQHFKFLLLQIRHDYIQDLINISQNNEIITLKTEIDNIKSRLDKLENPNTCLDNIFMAFKNNTLSDAAGDTLKSTWENSDSPLKVILKLSGKAFAKGLLTGVAKGSAISILSCVADSIL